MNTFTERGFSMGEVLGENTANARVVTPRQQRRTEVQADLRRAVWEASQFLDSDDIHDFVSDVLWEIACDTP